MTVVTLLIGLTIAVHGDEVPESIQIIRQVGPDGKGSAAAARAWKKLSQSSPEQLPEILAGMDGASDLARNWLRAAVDAIVARSEKGSVTLPVKELDRFLMERAHDPKARRLAYELIVSLDPHAPTRYLPKMLNDPSPDLRRDAVAQLAERAQKILEEGQKEEGLTLLRKAFTAARDQRQVVTLARQLRDQGQEIDLSRHLGLIQRWKLIGPFPYDEKTDPIHPPERVIDLSGEYEGKEGKVAWKDHFTEAELAIVNLNEALAPGTKQIAYAYAEYTSPNEREVQIRIGCFTKFKLWVNGELALDRADAYTGMRLDHYQTNVKLAKGKNTLLLKVYQAEPPPQLPTKLWQFMLRVCDPEGMGLLSSDRKS